MQRELDQTYRCRTEDNIEIEFKERLYKAVSEVIGEGMTVTLIRFAFFN